MHGYAVQYNRAGSDNDTTITFAGTLNTRTMDTSFTYNGEEYSINSIPEITGETVIPLQVLAKKDGEQTLP